MSIYPPPGLRHIFDWIRLMSDPETVRREWAKVEEQMLAVLHACRSGDHSKVACGFATHTITYTIVTYKGLTPEEILRRTITLLEQYIRRELLFLRSDLSQLEVEWTKYKKAMEMIDTLFMFQRGGCSIVGCSFNREIGLFEKGLRLFIRVIGQMEGRKVMAKLDEMRVEQMDADELEQFLRCDCSLPYESNLQGICVRRIRQFFDVPKLIKAYEQSLPAHLLAKIQ